MVNCKEMKREVRNEEAMKKFAESFGRVVHGGELFELVGDVGAGLICTG